MLQTDAEQALALASDILRLASRKRDRQGEAGANLLAGQALHRLARFQPAQAHLTAAAQQFERLGEAAQQASALILLAKVYRPLGDHALAVEALEHALQLSEHLGDTQLKADVFNHQASLSHIAGDSPQALRYLTTALELRQRVNDSTGAAQCLSNIGIIHLFQDNYAGALEALGAAYELLKTGEDTPTTANCLINIALVYGRMDDYQQAYSYHSRALEYGREAGDRITELSCLINLGGVAVSLDRYEEATQLFSQALLLCEQSGSRSLKGNAHHGLGQAALAAGRLGEALLDFQRALDIAGELGNQENEVEALLGLGEAALRLGEHAEAISALEGALTLAEQGERKKAVSQAHALLADVYQAAGRLPEALEHLRAHASQDKALFSEERERKTQQLTVQFDVERAQHEAEVSRLQTEVAQRAYEAAEAKVSERTERLARSQVEVVTRLANAAELRDDVTGEHTLRVGHVAALIAAQLGRPAAEVALLRLAARLHDVGKIGISDLILLKPEKLTLDEFERMKEHTLIGEQILSGGGSELLQMAEQIAAGHHEHWAGTGYPRRLAGTDIPLNARIVAVADVYDALSHARPYKRAWATQEVLTEMQRQSGLQFEPRIVEAFLKLHQDGHLPLRALPPDDQDVFQVLVKSSETEPGGSRDGGSPQNEAQQSGQSSFTEWKLQAQLKTLEAKYQETHQKVDALQIAAFTDALTGLANRRAFEDELETELLHAVRHGYPLSVISIDLDGLKRLNDSEGHERGDALLRKVADQLRTHLEAYGRLYRIGGDEFAVIVKQLGPEGHQVVLDHLQRAVPTIQAAGFPGAGMSAGIASFPGEAASEGDLLRLSDQRMYQHKLENRRRRSDLVGHP